MTASGVESIQARLETITRRWWFFVLLLALFFIPSHSSVAVDYSEVPRLVGAVVSSPLIYSYPALMPVFKILPILLVAGIALAGDRVTRLFNLYAALTILLFAVFQSMALTEEFGFAVLTSNLVVYSLVGLLWVWEALVKRNDFSPRRRAAWRYWVVPLAFLAFWFPVDTGTLSPDFSPILILTSEAGLTGCMMIPVYLAVLVLYHPRVNMAVLRTTAFAGLITGLLNAAQWFGFHPEAWWMGVLHLPLLLISLYAFVLSLKGDSALRTARDIEVSPDGCVRTR